MVQAETLADHVGTDFGVGGSPTSLAGPAGVYAESIAALAD